MQYALQYAIIEQSLGCSMKVSVHFTRLQTYGLFLALIKIQCFLMEKVECSEKY